MKKSTKTESVLTGKSSPKQIPKVTRGLGRGRCPCWLKKSQWKWSRCWLGNHHRKSFQRWRLDSEELAAPFDSEKVNKNGIGADWEIVTETPFKTDTWIRKSLPAPVDLEKVNENGVSAGWKILTETPSKSDAWIWKLSQPLLLRKMSTTTEPAPPGNHHRKTFQRDVLIRKCSQAVLNQKMERKQSRCRLEIITEKPSKGNMWIRKLSDTTKRLMSSPKSRSVEVINNPARPGSNHREVNCINYK